MTTTIVRITRHVAEATQVAYLQRAFGEIEIVTHDVILPTTPKEAVAKFDELVGDASIVEAVLPIAILQAVLNFSAFSKRGGKLIQAKMSRVARLDANGNHMVDANGMKLYDFIFDDFSSYSWIKEIKIVGELI